MKITHSHRLKTQFNLKTGVSISCIVKTLLGAESERNRPVSKKNYFLVRVAECSLLPHIVDHYEMSQ